jgi:hypothetical protein
MSNPAKKKYKTNNWSPYMKALRARGSLTMKVLFGLALRQTQGFVQSVLGLSGLDWQAPDYSTMSRRQKRLTVEIQARPSRGGLHLLVDSTGIKMLGEGEWKTRRPGAAARNEILAATNRLGRGAGRSGAATAGARWERPSCSGWPCVTSRPSTAGACASGVRS